ncbi:MAG TPA: hypothetical protein VG722_11970 [Tepidisphaeraceae bacterium]|nr:hypothetical protein [Tepidisphaeraceae bacterium]
MEGVRWKRDDYVRAARRVRGRYAHRPAEIHHRLRQLDAMAPAPSPSQIDRPEHDFASLVATRVHAGVLRYSDRLSLLAAAEKMGIGRFDANLLIALAQHRCRQRIAAASPRRTERWRLIAAALLTQGAILSVVYWLIR